VEAEDDTGEPIRHSSSDELMVQYVGVNGEPRALLRTAGGRQATIKAHLATPHRPRPYGRLFPQGGGSTNYRVLYG